VLRVLALVSGAIALVTGFLWIIPGISEGAIMIAFSICFFAYAAFALISIIAMIENVFTLEEVTADRIVGSICIYVLIGLFFSFIYLGLDLILPGTFNYVGREVMTLANVRDHIYFSYVTLTTLGYGDIVPLLPLPRLIATLEAMAGQVYLVVMVAMLVGVHVAKMSYERRKTDERAEGKS
jgi:voltage-gated potassium channel Kch